MAALVPSGVEMPGIADRGDAAQAAGWAPLPRGRVLPGPRQL